MGAKALAILFTAAALWCAGCGDRTLGQGCHVGECGVGLGCDITQTCQASGTCQGQCKTTCSLSNPICGAHESCYCSDTEGCFCAAVCSGAGADCGSGMACVGYTIAGSQSWVCRASGS